MASSLTPEQTRALFDILTHHETYAEIESFKRGDAAANYGFPFGPLTPDARAGAAPISQTLIARFVAPLPALRDLPQETWSRGIQGLLSRLGDADLSESYDKGAMGTRKTLATGSSSVMEMLGRGALGGVKRGPDAGRFDRWRSYDTSKAEDLEAAWENVLDGLVYGTLMDELWDHVGRTDDLEGHSPAAKAAIDYIIIHLATAMHHIFIMSPEGQYVLKLVENVHSLIPYKMVKQTLRLGNAATMMNAMMRLLLAKLSVAGLTNWVRLTNTADDGMNLLQRIISLVLSWDSSEFKKTAERLEKEKPKNRPSDEALKAIRQHVNAGRQQHEAVRDHSLRNGQSIVTAILGAADPALLEGLTDERHEQCMQYYSALLSVRDRDAMTAAMCRQSPDLFTQTVRELMQSYDPIIRTVHDKIDLREHFDHQQEFIDDFIKSSKVKDGERPGVENYVSLLQRHSGSLYRFLHAICSKCPEVSDDFRNWARTSLDKFKQDTSGPADAAGNPQSAMELRLGKLFELLAPGPQASVLRAIDAHVDYLGTLEAMSRARLQNVALTTSMGNGVGYSGQRTMAGPGVYLARWQALMDRTLITPAAAGRGPLRFGVDVKNNVALGKTTAANGSKSKKAEEPLPPVQVEEGPAAPDVRVVVKEMGRAFRHILQEVGGPDKSRV
ncbi:hypothetical protein HJFPF1_11854 [Paramyrothecium foliicola]|nr:hypothetical protein HJFPF1_11854 [Paramyrothecium foliicola]